MRHLMAALLGTMMYTCLPGSAFSKAHDKPNIIFIMADDLGYGDLGCYGQKLIRTPHIDQLASEGLRFTQAYAGGPVCTPSRATLMTGLHNGHSPARDNVPHYHTYLQEDDVTIAELLKEAGYRCGGVGKWSLGDAHTVGRATNQGFDMWFGYLNQDHAHHFYSEYLDDNEGRLELPGNSRTRKHYSHDLLTERAMKFVRDSGNEPFFLYAAYTIPHFSSPEEDKDRFPVPSTEPYSDRDWNERSKKYAAMVHRLDRDVGRLVALVGELGKRENTLIVFTSDNGGHKINGEHFRSSGPLRGFKRDLTEGGIRVPFIARWPGTVPAGGISKEVIAFQDMLPTMVSLAKGHLPSKVDGINILEALKGKSLNQPHPWLYWDYGHNRNRFDQAVRMGNWKGIRLGKDNPVQLYNLATDLGEEHDVSSAHPEEVEQIESIMEQAFVPDDRYNVGERYRGGAIWTPEIQHRPLPKPPPLGQSGEGAWLDTEFLFAPEKAPTPSCHSSTLVELPSGNLAAAWFGGTSEPDIDNVIWFTRKEEGNWIQPLMVVDGTEGETQDHRVGNPVLFQPEGGPLMLFYKVVDPKVGRASSWWGMLTTSTDEGKTWSTPRRLGRDPSLGEANPNLIGPVKNKPIQLADGSILCPSSTEHDGWRLHFELSRDQGMTWQVIGPVASNTGLSAIQPSLLQWPDGRMQVLCRSREGIVTESWSKDGGKSWGPIAPTRLPNPNSGTDATLLKDGRALLVYNHTVKRGPFPNNRGMLNVALSREDRTWDCVLTLEKEKGEFSYPYVIQTRDGLVHISYTWKRKSIRHVTLDPTQLGGSIRP